MSKLGDLGEKIAVEVLSRPQNGFVNVRNLNTEHPNHPYFDLYAERNGTRDVISVKTRREYGADGNLNDHFNLLEKSKGSVENEFQEFELVKAKAQEYNATAAWVMVVGGSSVFSAYFGLFEDVQRSGIYSVRMKPIHLAEYECLVENEPHQYPDFIRAKTGTVMKPDAEPKDVFTADYPCITAWVQSGGLIEMGTDYNVRSFIRALDEGGIIWEGEPQYPTMDAAFKALDAGIAAFLNEQGIKL